MLKEERHKIILDRIRDDGQVTVARLSELLDVSEVTIRRDLRDLDERGKLQRAHGGAILLKQPPGDLPYYAREHEQVQEKTAIARLAAGLIQDGETIVLDAGTTIASLARALVHRRDLTVITNSLHVVNELAGDDNIELIVIGGMFRKSEKSMVSHIAEQAIREFRADRVFMGMRGIDPIHGFTNDYLPEARTDRTILKMAPQIVIVADRSKLGLVSTVYLAPVTAAHLLITDTGAPRAARASAAPRRATRSRAPRRRPPSGRAEW